MATIKVACPKCGQKVSGDESFYGTVVECPICSADIRFPGSRREELPREAIRPVPPEAPPESALPRPELPAEEKPELPSNAGARIDEAKPADSKGGTKSGDTAKKDIEDEDDGPELPPSPIYGAISIVTAVLSVVVCGIGGVLFAPLAIIFGHTALAKARHSPVQPAPGHTLGAIGLMIGYVSLILTIIVLVLAVVFDLGDTIREWVQKQSA